MYSKQLSLEETIDQVMLIQPEELDDCRSMENRDESLSGGTFMNQPKVNHRFDKEGSKTHYASTASVIYIDKAVEDPSVIQDAFDQMPSNDGVFHMVSHGRPGELMIGGQWMSGDRLAEWLKEKQERTSFSELIIYGCRFAQGSKGRNAVRDIEFLLHVKVSASADITGAQGDWDLEHGHSNSGLNIADYRHSLQLDSVHYVPPMYGPYSSSNWNHQEIHLSTPSTNTVLVHVSDGAGNAIGPGNAGTAGVYRISNGTPYVLDLGNTTSAVTAVTKSQLGDVMDGNGEGLILQSTEKFYANFKVNGSSQGASLTCKGRYGMGTHFKWAGPPNRTTITGENGNSIMSIMAVEDNTVVDITDYDTDVVFVDGTSSDSGISDNSLQYNLMAGESVILNARPNIGTFNRIGFLGADVKSNNPIVVTTGGSNYAIETTSSRDIGIDQLVPISRLGTEYVVLQGNGEEDEQVIITGTVNGTKIWVNGNYFGAIGNGDFIEIPGTEFSGNRNMFIESSAPVYTHHSLRGVGNTRATDGLNFIPPLSCFNGHELNELSSPRVIDNISYDNSEIHITSAAGASVQINGATPSVSSQSVLGTSTWVTYRVPIDTNDDYTVTSTGPISVSIFGGSGAVGYAGYFSGFGTAPELSYQTDATCFGELSVVSDTPISNYQWELNGTAIPGAVHPSYEPILAGNYSVVVGVANSCFSNTSTYQLTYANGTSAAGLSSCNDNDNDGVANHIDLDDDNDGILDECECDFESLQDGAYTSSQISFVINGDLSDFTAPQILEAIVIDGVSMQDFILPDTYSSLFTSLDDPSDLYIMNNGVEEVFYSTATNWNAEALPCFQSQNLNYYQGLDATTDELIDHIELGYNTPVRVNSQVFIAFLERNGNNSVFIEAFDVNGLSLGNRVEVSPADYIETGYNLAYTPTSAQRAEIAIYPLDDFAPGNSQVSSIRIYYDSPGSDAADSKVFIFGNNSAQDPFYNDTDTDGIIDCYDLDSDNDGIYDSVESGSGQPHSDGVLQGGVNTEGVPLSVSNGASGVNYVVSDLNSDGSFDFQNLDSDGDGCPDVREAGFPDADGDLYLGGLAPPTVDDDGRVTSGGL